MHDTSRYDTFCRLFNIVRCADGRRIVITCYDPPKTFKFSRDRCKQILVTNQNIYSKNILFLEQVIAVLPSPPTTSV